MRRRDFVLSAAGGLALAHAGAWANTQKTESLYQPTQKSIVLWLIPFSISIL